MTCDMLSKIANDVTGMLVKNGYTRRVALPDPSRPVPVILLPVPVPAGRVRYTRGFTRTRRALVCTLFYNLQCLPLH